MCDIVICVYVFLVCCAESLNPVSLCDPMDCSLPGSSVPGDSPGENTKSGCHALPPGDLLNPGIKPGSPALQVDSVPAVLPGKVLIYF